MEIEEKKKELKIKGKVAAHQPMRSLTSLGIGGEADFLSSPRI